MEHVVFHCCSLIFSHSSSNIILPASCSHLSFIHTVLLPFRFSTSLYNFEIHFLNLKIVQPLTSWVERLMEQPFVRWKKASTRPTFSKRLQHRKRQSRSMRLHAQKMVKIVCDFCSLWTQCRQAEVSVIRWFLESGSQTPGSCTWGKRELQEASMEQNISANAQEECTELVRNAIPLYFGEQCILSSYPSVYVPTTSTLSEWLEQYAPPPQKTQKQNNSEWHQSKWTCSPSCTVVPNYFLTVFPSQFRC